MVEAAWLQWLSEDSFLCNVFRPPDCRVVVFLLESEWWSTISAERIQPDLDAAVRFYFPVTAPLFTNGVREKHIDVFYRQIPRIGLSYVGSS